MTRACPSCGHFDLGTIWPVESWLRRVLRLPPARPECTFDDGMGGGLEYDGRCGCTDDYHSVGGAIL